VGRINQFAELFFDGFGKLTSHSTFNILCCPFRLNQDRSPPPISIVGLHLNRFFRNLGAEFHLSSRPAMAAPALGAIRNNLAHTSDA
jgi:hypothetical protein